MPEKSVEKNWKLFPGFEIEIIATGFKLPVNLAFAPNPGENPNAPFLYVAELYGSVKAIANNRKIYTYADGLLNYSPDYKLPGTGESGLIGICAEPKTGDLFLSMLYLDKENDEIKAKVVRTASKDGLKMDSIKTIINDIPSVKAAHQIQALSIGPDGKLYINVGDGMLNPKAAQDDNDLRGKILRMNLDGSIPKDNPCPNSFVFAKGLRNPFGAAWRKSDKKLYISDNGPETDDRIAKIEAGKNYSWPESMRKNSIFWWHFTQAPTAMDFMQNNEYGEEFDDELFVALFGAAYSEGWDTKGKKIVKMKLNKNGDGIKSCDEFVTYVGDSPASPCGLAFGPGGLYFTDLHGENKDIKIPSGNILRVKPILKKPEQGIPDTEKNRRECICDGCPSYNQCMAKKLKKLFCSIGKSGCEIKKQGCICGECPIAGKYQILGFYFCAEGAVK